MSGFADYADDLGVSPSAPAPAAGVQSYMDDLGVKPKAANAPTFAPTTDVRGGTLLQQSPATQRAVLADIQRRGAQNATVNGYPLDAPEASPQPVANAGRGSAPASAYWAGANQPKQTSSTLDANGYPLHWYDPLTRTADAVGGAGETITNAALGAASAIGGGIAKVAGSVATGNLEGGDRWKDWAERNISTVAGLYDPTPTTQTGQAAQEAFNAATNKVKQWAGTAGNATLGATGSPALATVADVGTQAAAQIAAGAAAKGIFGGRVSGDSEKVSPALDQGGGKEPLSVSSQGLDRQVLGGGAAVSSSNPYPALTGQQLVRGGDFPQIKLTSTSGDVPAGEQAVRSAIATKILGEGGEGADRVRPGVVSGNEDTLRMEGALAKASDPTPRGLILRDKIAEEQRALPKFADNIVNSTGASPTMLNDGMRGDLLNSTLQGPDGLTGYLSSLKGQIYNEAAQRQGPNPVDLPSLDKMLNSPQLGSSLKIAGLPNVLPGVQELLQQFKTNGFENPVTGESIPPNSVAGAMELHKALNAAWTPDNSMYIGRMKRAIMDDVAQAGGADLYQQGNAIHAAEQTLTGAPGMKKIFGEVDPNTGIAAGKSPEQILPAIKNLPVDQFTHVYNVFSDMANGKVPGAPGLQLPPELRQAAAQSLKEISGSLVRDVRNAGADKAGVWNGNSVNNTLNAYTQKLNIAAPPDVMRDLHTLNIGSQIMPGMHAYEGAAQQARRMDQAGLLERHAVTGGELLGGMTGMPLAATAGRKVGTLLQGSLGARRQLKSAAQTDAQMESAAKLGTNLRDLMK